MVPALKSPTKQIFGHCSSSHNCLNLPRYAKNSSVLALLQYGRYTLVKHNSDFFENTLNPIIEPSQFEKDEALRFLDQLPCFVPFRNSRYVNSKCKQTLQRSCIAEHLHKTDRAYKIQVQAIQGFLELCECLKVRFSFPSNCLKIM